MYMVFESDVFTQGLRLALEVVRQLKLPGLNKSEVIA